MPNVHVVENAEAGWDVKHAGSDDVIGHADTQAEAERWAKQHAREHGDAEVVTHGAHGSIVGSDTMDPAHEGSGRDTRR
jgi:hypothetical protein